MVTNEQMATNEQEVVVDLAYESVPVLYTTEEGGRWRTGQYPGSYDNLKDRLEWLCDTEGIVKLIEGLGLVAAVCIPNAGTWDTLNGWRNKHK